ncbi:MAG: Fe-S cluster assembly protein SufD [Gammaproteobacteria bacterium]|nr:MAG: Fe-S cluster assembly protein SufD [Gammaproteobacteria bacterium]
MKQITELATPFASISSDETFFGDDLPWLKSLRLKARTQFNNAGLPAKKEEDWKYTSLRPFARQQFNHGAKTQPLSVEQCNDYALLDDAYRFVIIDGVFSAELSKIDGLQAGLIIRPLSEAVDLIQPHLGQQVELTKPGFTALNTMMMSEGMAVTVDSNVKIEKTIELLVINSGESANLATHLRHVIVLADNSEATIIEHYLGLNADSSFTNTVTEVILAESAQLKHYKLQQESSKAFHIATLAAKQAAKSQWTTNSISLGAKLARNDVHTQLLGEQSHVVMDGLYLVDNDQHVDFHTRIDHTVANTTSDELYKGILNGNSHGVFNGKVMVHKDAQKTDANQQNHNLLLSRGCEIDTKPEMEIYADDVKCGHGSTVGQINADHLFFLRSRGLDEVSARSLLTYAFTADVLDRIDSELIRTALANVVEQRLPKPSI